MTSPAGADLDLSVFADLGVSIGRLAREMEHTRLEAARRSAEIWPINIQMPPWNGAGTFDLGRPTMGPSDGYAWMIHRLTAATFTAGTVNVYKGAPADNNLMFAFTQAGVFYPPRTNFILMPSDKLTFAAAASAPITGTVTISLDATQMTTRHVSEFLS
jgi:hypothetical protein